jgi:hypothetical protein
MADRIIAMRQGLRQDTLIFSTIFSRDTNVNFYWFIMVGGTIVPRSLKTKGNPKKVQSRPKFFFFNQTTLYLLIIVFPKFDPLTATGMDVSILSQNVKIYSPQSETKGN